MSGIKFTNQIKMSTAPTEDDHVVRMKDLPPVFLTQAEYAALESPANSGLYPSLVGKRVVITDDKPVMSTYFPVPDLANQESVNRITGGTWTSVTGGFAFNSNSWTADRAGFVVCYLDFGGSAAGGWGDILFRINGKILQRSGSLPSCYALGATLPVVKGDVVTFVRFTEANEGDPRDISCYFVPPKFAELIPPTVVTEPNGSYSLSEVKTAQTWIDGKPIYRKIFTLSDIVITAATDYAPANVSLGVTGVSQVVSHRLFGNGQVFANYAFYWTASNRGHVFSNAINNAGSLEFYIRGYNSAGISFSNVKFLVEYTKTTD
jgi:hypothetical protein